MDEGPGRVQRAVVLVVLGALLVAGVGVVEAWPLTAWRLFNVERHVEQGGWALQAVAADGAVTPVALGQLPPGYRMAAHPIADAVEARSGGGARVCAALLEEVRRSQPDATELRILRTRRRLVEADGRWGSVEVATEEVLRCGATEAP